MNKTIFQQIIDKEIKADIIYEDEHCLAFHDINPKAPIHVLLIPKQPIEQLSHLTTKDSALMGHMMVKVAEIAEKLGIDNDGFRVVINNGSNACQTVFHLHLHILGGRRFSWPPG